MKTKTTNIFIMRIFAVFVALCLIAASPPPKPKTRQVETLSQQTYDEITRAQTLAAKGQHKQALAALNTLLKNNDSNNHERAIILQQTAFIWLEQENFSQAIKLLLQALALEALSEQEELNALFNLAQIYIASAQYKQGIKILNQWMKRVETVPPRAYALLAQAWALLDELKRATPYAEKAVNATQTPRKNWLHLLITLYLQQELYRKALPVSEQGAKLYPKDRIFWNQLVGLYGELKMYQKSFAAQRTMHELNLFTKSSEYVRLAQTYLSYEAPIPAASLLEEGFRKNVVEKNDKNYTLLGDAWLMAREWHKAIKPLTQAAALVKHGKIWQRLGNSYIENENWVKAEQAFENALAKGQLSDDGRVWLLLGVARAKQNKRQEAFAALGRAIEYDKISSEAKAWMDNLRANPEASAP